MVLTDAGDDYVQGTADKTKEAALDEGWMKKFQQLVVAECIDCEFCGGSIMQPCKYLNDNETSRRCTMHDKINTARQDTISLTEDRMIWKIAGQE